MGGRLTGPGPRWIGCRIKGSSILAAHNPSPESHLQRTKEQNPSTAIGNFQINHSL